jgi:predicted O-methyltransferase YrrM
MEFTAPVLEDLCLYISSYRLPPNDESKSAEALVDEAYNFEGLGPYKSIEPSPRFPEDRVVENKTEYAKLARLVKKNDPETMLEIGTARGGSLYLWSRYFESLSKIVSLDAGTHIEHYKSRIRLFEKFADTDTEFVISNSHEESTYDKIKNCIKDKKIDFLLIDGDHSYDGVKSDFHMYSDLVSDNGIIAFHDIVNEEWPGVGKFWREIESEYDTTEIIEHPERLGIGVINV